MISKDWYDYQEEAAALFRSMGLAAETNVTIRGARTTHDVDVVVKSRHAGFDITWLIECKHWKVPVSKMHVLALREIVADTGADRGILLCEQGFQSGAIEAAKLTNVQVTSLEHVLVTSGGDISAMRLRELYDRTEACRIQYWAMSKHDRIERGLRPEVSESGYSGAMVVELCTDLITRAFRGTYPITVDSSSALAAVRLMVVFGKERQFNSAEEILSAVTPLITELEGKLTATL